MKTKVKVKKTVQSRVKSRKVMKPKVSKVVPKAKISDKHLKDSLLHFSISQQNSIRTGTAVRQQLVKIVNEACDRKDSHTYIYSQPGFGKTFTVTKALEKRDVDFHTISGNTSMFAFCCLLAVIDDQTPKGEKIVINVDDCDEILGNEQNINIIKSILEGERILRYEKSMAAFKSSLTEVQLTAIENHANPNSMGFQVDCKNMKFIFTSNKKLPTKFEVEKKPSAMNNHLHAIRSRCFTEDFNHAWDIMWGWLVDIVLTTNVKYVTDLKQEQKLILLDWMYNNWNEMKEASIRTCSKMALTMLDSPKNYKTAWELSYLNR